MGSGWWSTVNTRWSIPWYMRCSMGSCSASAESTGKNSSMRLMPLRLMFWVISTALVLQGVIISLRGPTK